MAYKLYIEDNETYPAVIWGDSAPSGFTDNTSNIIAWDLYGEVSVNKYTIRTTIFALVLSETNNFVYWASYAEDKKQIAVKWACAPYSLRVPDIVSESEDKANWSFLIPSIEGNEFQKRNGRVRIYQEMWLCVSDYVRKDAMTREDAQQFFKDQNVNVDYFVRADMPDFYQWLTNEVGSPYENAGFEQESYYIASLEDDIVSIYNGEFEL